MEHIGPKGLTIKYEVADLAKTMDFYDILLGHSTGEFLGRHVNYCINGALMVSFRQNVSATSSASGHFTLFFESDKEVYDRFYAFSNSVFIRNALIDPGSFTIDDHSFTITDPNGIIWNLSAKKDEPDWNGFVKVPRVVSMWDILKH